MLGVVNGPPKKSQQILSNSQNLLEFTNGSWSLRFCVCRSHTCFSVKSLHFFVSGSDFKMPVSASRRVLDLPFATPHVISESFLSCVLIEMDIGPLWEGHFFGMVLGKVTIYLPKV